MPETSFTTTRVARVPTPETVAAVERLNAALADRALIDTAIEQASARIAGGFSREAAVAYDERLARLRKDTWGE